MIDEIIIKQLFNIATIKPQRKKNPDSLCLKTQFKSITLTTVIKIVDILDLIYNNNNNESNNGDVISCNNLVFERVHKYVCMYEYNYSDSNLYNNNNNTIMSKSNLWWFDVINNKKAHANL